MAELPHTMIRMKPVAGVGFLAGFNGVLNSVKGPNLKSFSASVDLCAPLVSILGPVNTVKPRCVDVAELRVSKVCPSVYVPQVFNPIVCPIPVDVVNISVRPFIVCQRPKDPVGLVSFGKYISTKVSLAAFDKAVKGWGVCKSSVKCRALAFSAPMRNILEHIYTAVLPKHFARSGVVRDEAMQNFRGNYNIYYPFLLTNVSITGLPQGGNT